VDGAVSLRLAAGPVSWGVDFAGDPANPPWRDVLDGIRAAGYGGVELGPVGYMPTDPRALAAELEERALEPVGTFVFEPLHDPEQLPRIAAAGRAAAALVAAVGGRHLVGIDSVTPERERTAGRPEAAPRLDAAGRRALARAIGLLDRIASDAGLVFALHPHAGSFVEFGDEIEWAAQHAALCLDTGHLAYAGLDPVGEIARYGDRLALLHLKDVDPAVHGDVLRRGDGFWDAVAAGVFCPLGAGVVELDGVVAAAERLAHVSWATVEQDRRGTDGDPVADLRASRAALERAWIA
jgi:inosose dehydratase